VIGVDIDSQAIQSSNYNAGQNTVSAKFYLADQSTANQVQPADIVVANILSSALSVLAPLLAAACRPGGKIALSGILREQTEQLTVIYATWFQMDSPIHMDNWVLLTGTRE